MSTLPKPPSYEATCATYKLDPDDGASLDAILGRLDFVERMLRKTVAGERYWFERFCNLAYNDPMPDHAELLAEVMKK